MGKKIRFRSYDTIYSLITELGPALVKLKDTEEGVFCVTENGMLMFDIENHLDRIKAKDFIVRETAQDIEIIQMAELTDDEKIEIMLNRIPEKVIKKVIGLRKK